MLYADDNILNTYLSSLRHLPRPPPEDLCGLVASKSQGVYQPHDLLPFHFQTT